MVLFCLLVKCASPWHLKIEPNSWQLISYAVLHLHQQSRLKCLHLTSYAFIRNDGTIKKNTICLYLFALSCLFSSFDYLPLWLLLYCFCKYQSCWLCQKFVFHIRCWCRFCFWRNLLLFFQSYYLLYCSHRYLLGSLVGFWNTIYASTPLSSSPEMLVLSNFSKKVNKFDFYFGSENELHFEAVLELTYLKCINMFIIYELVVNWTIVESYATFRCNLLKVLRRFCFVNCWSLYFVHLPQFCQIFGFVISFNCDNFPCLVCSNACIICYA